MIVVVLPAADADASQPHVGAQSSPRALIVGDVIAVADRGDPDATLAAACAAAALAGLPMCPPCGRRCDISLDRVSHL